MLNSSLALTSLSANMLCVEMVLVVVLVVCIDQVEVRECDGLWIGVPLIPVVICTARLGIDFSRVLLNFHPFFA